MKLVKSIVRPDKVDEVREALEKLKSAGMTVTDVRGHAPRDAGAKMVVSDDGVWGSVGGGNLEETAVARARELLQAPPSAPESLTMSLNDKARTEHGRHMVRFACCKRFEVLDEAATRLASLA